MIKQKLMNIFLITVVSLSMVFGTVAIVRAEPTESAEPSAPASSAEPVSSAEPGESPEPSEVPVAGAKDKLPLKVEFLGKGDLPSDSKVSAVLTDIDAAAKSEFWIGVSTESIETLKMYDLELFKSGMYSLEMSFVYDNNIVEPYVGTNASATTNQKEAIWNSELHDGNINTDGSKDAKAWWSNEYNLMSAYDAEVVSDTETEDLSLTDSASAGADWKMCTVNIKFTGADIANARFTDLSSENDSKVYLMKFPFTLKAIPTTGTTRVIRLVRGPETFNIGSGAGGRGTASLWEKTVVDDSRSNLKNVFDFKGDINLFGGESIVDIFAQSGKITEGTEGMAVGDSQTLYHTEEMSADAFGFEPDVEEYWVSVPNEVEELKLFVESSEDVTIGGVNADKETVEEAEYYVRNIPLTELNPDTVATDNGFLDANKITVTSGSSTYIIHIRRFMKFRIDFNPGNSPFGLMERMLGEADANGQVWDADYVAQAKEMFIHSDDANEESGKAYYGNLTYVTNYVPDGVPADVLTDNALLYTESAWESYVDKDKNVINYDMDEEALFVYTKDSYFKDPGFVAYDETGTRIDESKIQKELKVKVKKTNGEPAYTDAEVDNETLTEITEGDITAFTFAKNKTSFTDELRLRVRPDVYFIEYYYKADEETAPEKVGERPVVVLTPRGDVSFTDRVEITTGDLSTYQTGWSNFRRKNSLFAFRVADLAYVQRTEITTGDLSSMTTSWSKGFKDFYNTSILQ